MKARDKGFTQGFVYALAQLIRNGNVYDAEWLWHESNFVEKDLNVCDDYDANNVRKHLEDWS